MSRLIATVLAVHPRLESAELVRRTCANALGEQAVRMFVSDEPMGRRAANLNLVRALTWARDQEAEWHLFLEDDQRVYPEFFRSLPALLRLADEIGVEAFYLANRRIDFDRQEHHGGFVLNRITKPVLGSHGLLYRCQHLDAWGKAADGDVTTPMDGLFFAAIPPGKNAIYQVVAPVLMQHVGIRSTLHTYANDAHLNVNGVESETLCRIQPNQ